MKIQTGAVDVVKRTSAYLKCGLLKEQPAWYDVVASAPPLTKFTREPVKRPPDGTNDKPQRHGNTEQSSSGLFVTRLRSRDKKIENLYRIPRLAYLEDKLRSLFYAQHPWEMSRPRILIENALDGSSNWSSMRQLGKPLDGESVVQRTLYLLHNGEYKELPQAYERARREFYALRMQEEQEQQVAAEEAAMYGTCFHDSAIMHGLRREQRVIDQWKEQVIRETESLAARQAQPAEAWEPEIVDQEVEELVL